MSQKGITLAVVGSAFAAFGLVWGCGLDAIGTFAAAEEAGIDTGLFDTGSFDTGGGGGNAADADIDVDAGPFDVCDASCVVVPTGWSLEAVVDQGPAPGSALDPAAPPGFTCPPGFAQPERVARDAGGGTQCGCSCGAPQSNPCQLGNLVANQRTSGSQCNDGTVTFNANGNCNALAAPLTADALDAPARPVGVVDCAQTTTLPPLVAGAQLGVCAAVGDAGTCVAAGAVCTPLPGAGALCVVRDGDHPCPAGFGTKRHVVPSAGITDTRVCGNCGCTSDATSCSNARLGFYTNGGCNQNEQLVNADNACNDVMTSGATHYRYTATPNTLACTAANPTTGTSGAITLPPVRTLCCP